jgi:hypothetical protein
MHEPLPISLRGKSGALIKFNPKQTRMKVGALKGAIGTARKIEDWKALDRAIDELITEQHAFVAWWDDKVGQGQGPGRGKTVAKTGLFSVTAATAQTGVSKQQVSTWRGRLAHEDIYRARLHRAAHAVAWGLHKVGFDEPVPVLAAGHGNNSALIREAVRFLVRDGDTVADVTFGRGAFWTETDTSRFTLLKSDINPAAADIARADLRALPYADASINVVVLDPPYTVNLKGHELRDRYNRGAGNMTREQCRELFRAGMAEAKRVLRPGGLVWVKCKDQVDSGKQYRQHIEVWLDALELGLVDRELFTLLTPPPNLGRWRETQRQRHARKNYSFLWVFEKAGKD